MANSRDHQFLNDCDDFDDSLSDGGSPASTSNNNANASSGVSERLTESILNEGDGDLLMREDMVFRWLQALDLQVMGACRSDERLKPLLKSNVSDGIAEDRFLAQLSQHFEPAEVGMLARCFCIPLVSIRVGKIVKQDTVLCPTSSRGNLNITLLPTSGLRISFIGDNGNLERLATLISNSHCAAVAIEEIPADNSGRSFLIRIPEDRTFYFWCSEKSKLLGVELLSKMRSILKRKPTVAELTGISESRLGCFASHLRAYLGESTGGSSRGNASGALSTFSDTRASDVSRTSHSSSAKFLRARHTTSQTVKASTLYQGSLGPRSCSFKEGLPKSSCLSNSPTREKLRRHGDSHISSIDNRGIALPAIADPSISNCSESKENPEAIGTRSASASSFLESLGKLASPPITRSASQAPFISSTLLSPYYCWCPPGMSTLPHSGPPANFPSTVKLGALPTPSSLATVDGSTTFWMPLQPLGLADVPRNFTDFLPSPLLPLPIPSSQQIPTFNSLMCDPIVHIPVIDVCSSGQGYLVSAGSAISTTIPQLHANLVNPLLPETDPMVEKGARETLRLLISNSSPTSPQLFDALPVVLSKANEKQNVFAAGSRGLYSGTVDVNAIASSVSSVVAWGLASGSGVSFESGVDESCRISHARAEPERSTDLGSSHSEGENNKFTDIKKGRADF